MAPPGGDIKFVFHRSLNFLLYHMQKTFFAYLHPKKVAKFLSGAKKSDHMNSYMIIK